MIVKRDPHYARYTHNSLYFSPEMFVVGHPKNINMHMPGKSFTADYYASMTWISIGKVNDENRFTDGVREGGERDPRGHRSGVWIFLQYEHARYYDPDAHHHDAVNAWNDEKITIVLFRLMRTAARQRIYFICLSTRTE